MSPDNPLIPTLDHAKAVLKTALEEACGTDVDRADTGELIRIEEVLAIANEAAKEAVSVRRRLRSKQAESSGSGSALREVVDEAGVNWAVMAVHPSGIGKRSGVREKFRDGWLSFTAGDDTRRVAPIPAAWETLSDAELLALRDSGEQAPRRRGSASGSAVEREIDT